MPELASVDEGHFRHVLGHLPTGVVVVTGMCDAEPVGLAVSSFTSVSLDPPLVGFFPGKSSTSWPRILPSGAFCANILGHDQENVSRAFASQATDKFAGIGWQPTGTGSPLIDGVCAWIDCRIERVDDAGDHTFVLGRVVEMDLCSAPAPLIFFRGTYGRLSV
jgi:3-hydroxy-9,10-secoandrosta-1,3,5(10)-triene-9,17-dione monooxygenase reductase component